MRKLKRFFAALVCIILALSACRNSDSESMENGTESGTENSASHADSGELSWRARRVILDRQYASAAVSEDMLYGAYYEGEGAVVEYLRKDYGDTLEVSAEKQVPLTGIFYVQKMFCDSDGNVYVFGLDEKNYNSLWRIDPEGNVQTVWDVPGEEASRGSGEEIIDPEPKAVFEGEDGSVYIRYEMGLLIDGIIYMRERIYKLSPEGEVLFYAQVRDSGCVSILKDGSGELLFLQEDEEGLYTQAMDPQSGELKEAVRLKEAEDLRDDYPLMVPEEGAFLFCKGSSYDIEGELYEFRLDTQERETVLDLSAFGIRGEDILCLGRVGGGIELVDNPTEQGNSEFTLLERGREEDVTVLTFAQTGMGSSCDEIIAAFNRSRTDIRVEKKDYFKEFRSSKNFEELNLEIAMGTAPDVIWENINFGGTDLLAANGAFADLYDFMENDEELTKESFLPTILQLCEQGGKLYYIPPGFQIRALAGSPLILEDRQNLTLSELLQALKENGKGLDAIATWENGVEFFNAGIEEFIDWESGTCDFENDGFKKLLSFIKEYRNTQHDSTAKIDTVREGKVLVSDFLISDVAGYQLTKVLYGEDAGIIGYPAGGESSGISAYCGGICFAIYAKSQHPKEAWEFLKYFLIHYREYFSSNFPIIREQFEEKLEQSMVQEYWPGEDGKPDLNSPKPKGTLGQGPAALDVYAASKEDVETVRELVDRIDRRHSEHEDLIELINEEAEYYYQGQKSVDEVAKIIQSRISLWLQEQM